MLKRIIVLLIIVFIIYLIYNYFIRSSLNNSTILSPSPTLVVHITPGESGVLGEQTKTSGCQVNGPLQDPACTPGAIFQNATKDKICVTGYSRSVRNVPLEEKHRVYDEYGIYHHVSGAYEVDHLISLELGGSNDIANLWPEAANPRPGYHEKDRVENYLHAQVCSGALDLQTAQKEISTNWLNVYNQLPADYK